MPTRKGTGGGGRKLFVARQAFASNNGETVVVQPGQFVDAGDPVMKGREDLFEPFEDWADRNVRRYDQPRVEQATAAPGEKRG